MSEGDERTRERLDWSVVPGGCPPVALLVFNRPDCTREVMRRVRAARPPRLWVVADGPRVGRPGEAERVKAVRQLVEEFVDWPCEVRRIYADENLGCARRVSSGLDAVFAVEQEAVVLEDDCVPDPSFFVFCAELLQRYRDDDRVGVISGDNFQRGRLSGEASYYFSRYPHCWGWATWRRAWHDYDHAMADWPALRRGKWLAPFAPTRGELRYWKFVFDQTLSGGLDSWAYRWTFACWRRGRLTVLPCRNLVSNIGFDDNGTHTRGRHAVAGLAAEEMDFPLRHPGKSEVDDEADARTARLLFRRPSLPARVLHCAIARVRSRGKVGP